MSDAARQYILTRRGIGINDLTEVTLTNGELDTDQALTTGVYKVNSTHQVGIATATEVGLSADRFPIRVVIVNDMKDVQAETVNVACRYWTISDASGNSIPFSRKALTDELPIANLYKIYPDLDDRLWDMFRANSGRAINTERDDICDGLNDTLNSILKLQSPAADQYAIARSCIEQIMAYRMESSRVAYFKIDDNVYMSGVPAGKSYKRVGHMGASKVALMEGALTIQVNYNKLKAKYTTVPEGAVTLAAYSIAGMFRMGLQETYEHEEYYTVYVSPAPKGSNEYTILDCKIPRGAPQLTGYSAGSTIVLENIKFKTQLVEISNLLVMASGLMHYLFNHTTGGTILTGALLTVLAMYRIVSDGMPRDLLTEITSLFYEALHPANKRAIANIMFKNSSVYTHSKSTLSSRYEQFCYDSFTSIRANPYPAGSHKAFVCLQALRRVLQAGLAPFLPWADQLAECIASCKAVLNNGARSHIGSYYYTGAPPISQPTTLDNYLPELAQYIQVFNKGDSLSMSPHVSPEVSKRAGMNWQNLLRELKAKDVSGTHIDTVREFLTTSGTVSFTFDPTQKETWGKAVTDSRVAMKAIDSTFT